MYKLQRIGNFLFNNFDPFYLRLYSFYKLIVDYQDRSLVKKYFTPGAVAVDIGANIGIYTKLLSKLAGSKGRVHSFEPSPDNFLHLKANTRNLSNVVINQKAIGNTTGLLKLYVSHDLNVDHRTYPTDDVREIKTVDCIRLDDYFHAQRRVDFIKMDIQGFEYQAFLGMQRLIEENPNIIILFEFWPIGLKAAGTSPNMLLELLHKYGFNLYVIHKRALTAFSSSFINDNHTYINILAARCKLI